MSFYVHHEPTFDRDEIRRHLTVVVLTPTRLIVAHRRARGRRDDHRALHLDVDQAIALVTVRFGRRARMVTDPTSGTAPAAEAVVTIGWGGVSRLDLEPAGCQDPECEADHGYTGVLASDDFSIRASATADGPDAVAGLLAFAESLSARGRSERESSSSRPMAAVRSSTWCRPSGRRSGSSTRPTRTGLVLPGAPAYVVFLVDGLGPGCWSATRGRAVPRHPARVPAARHVRGPLDRRPA